MTLEITTKVEGSEKIQERLENAKLYSQNSINYSGMKKAKSVINQSSWASLTDMAKKLRKAKGEGDNPLAWYLRFFRYRNKKDSGKVGFLGKGGKESPFFQENLKYSEEGRSIPVTPKMRRYLGARGTPIKSITSILRTPKRPILELVEEFLKNESGKTYQEKFSERMNK